MDMERRSATALDPEKLYAATFCYGDWPVIVEGSPELQRKGKQDNFYASEAATSLPGQNEDI